MNDFVRSARWDARSRGRVQRHPDYICVATAVQQEAGVDVRFVDAAAQNWQREDVVRLLKEERPEWVVMHASTPAIENDIAYCRLAKEICDARTILVGQHVSAEPEDTFARAGGALDLIALGEYDYTLRDLFLGKAPADTPGLCIPDGLGNFSRTGHRPFIEVNDLPFPAWEFIEADWYHDGGKLHPFITLLSGRGCFARCTFCRDPQLMYGHENRYRDPKLVVDEMEYDLSLFPDLREIMIETDTFTANREHVEGVCREILNRGLDTKLRWSVNARSDVKRDLLQLMKRAGGRMLMVGYEFGSQKSLDNVKKGMNLRRAREFTGHAADLGFTIHGCFMIGAPGETEETARETIDFAKGLPLDTIQISGVSAYPGTELYDWAKKEGHLVPDSWEDYLDENHEQVTVLDYPQLPKERIDELIDTGLREFYLRPKQMLRMALAMRGIGDLKRKFHGLKSFIDYMGGNARKRSRARKKKVEGK